MPDCRNGGFYSTLHGYIISVILDSILIVILFFSPLAINGQPSAFESLEGQVGDLGNTKQNWSGKA